VTRAVGALVLAGCACFVALSCGAAQDAEQAKFGAIVAGCIAGLDVDREAGAAGAIDDETKACRETQHQWEKRP
jgi:hypothetical protein